MVPAAGARPRRSRARRGDDDGHEGEECNGAQGNGEDKDASYRGEADDLLKEREEKWRKKKRKKTG